MRAQVLYNTGDVSFRILDGSRIRSCPSNFAILILATLGLIAGTSCSRQHGNHPYQTVAEQPTHDNNAAQKLNEKGLKLIESGDLHGAEQAFRGALQNDLYSASAHNNLGLVLLRSKRYYDAAWEFEFASRLAPDVPEPRQNLGLLYENVGRTDDAISEYEKTLEQHPQSIVAMRHLARAYVKADRKDDRLKTLLEKLLLVPDGGQWDVWARGQLVRVGRTDSSNSAMDAH